MTFMQLNKNRNLTFWSLHAMGWMAYGFAQYAGALLYGKAIAYTKVILIASTTGFVLSSWLRLLCRQLWKQPPAVMIGLGLLGAYLTALAWRIPVNMAYMALFPEERMHFSGWIDYFGGTMSSTYLMVCWMGLYFGFHYYESMQVQREATLRHAALAQEAQLKMLRYQLNPHFLFNTLNAISTLILDNRNTVANSAVTGLSEFLRYTLDQDPMKKVTVAQEVDALNLYLNIEKLRFGPRLTIEFAIDANASTMLMPSLLLQPLIENAIKYAVSPREQGGTIRIGGHVTGGMLQLEVADNGPGMVDASRLTNGRGVGVRNTRERLQVLYGDRGVVHVANTEPGLRVALTFPAESGAQRAVA
jgi:two-component system, LytTR family, sensor kinase